VVSNSITGGVFIGAVIQGNTVTVVLPPTVVPALSGLPPASSTFTGRDAQIRLLTQALAPSGNEDPVPASAVAGLAGVGKTELVVQAATKALKETIWFPGGVLFVDMFGYDPQRRLSAEAALVSLLQALGMPGEHIPATENERSRLFRSVLAAFAAQSRRILLVIDNAATADQVTPLLPSDGVTATLITSRHTLDVGARLYDLNVLDRVASVELLADVLRQARGPADTRVHDEPDAAATIAELCAGLPLALRIAAALLFDTPTRPVTSLAHALSAEHTRLDRLTREERAVRATFDLSYQHLNHRQALLFRLLPINSGPDISTDAAAHLAGLELSQAEQILQDLGRSHLVEPGRTWGRWRLHDLVRLYADENGQAHADVDHRDSAQIRLLKHYCDTARAADTYLDPPPATLSARFGDRTAALAWLDEERANLLAACAGAVALGQLRAGIDLAFALDQYFDYCHHFNDWLAVTTTTLPVCRATGDRRSESRALNNLGLALRQLRRFNEAVAAHQQDLAICQETGNRRGEGTARTSLGSAFIEMRRFDEAITALRKASAILGGAGDHHGEGQALGNLGIALSDAHRFDEAIAAIRKAAAIFRAEGDRRSEGIALNNLGAALRDAHRLDEAIRTHEQGLAIVREIGDRHSESAALNNLGVALALAHRFDEAISAYQHDLTICRETDDRYGEGQTLTNLGTALTQAHRYDEAIGAIRTAAAIFVAAGDRHGEGQALANLGLTFLQVSRVGEATGFWAKAIEAFIDSGDSDAAAMVKQWLDDFRDLA
jgi:tetratricopeptide (TPR) repeat protein